MVTHRFELIGVSTHGDWRVRPSYLAKGISEHTDLSELQRGRDGASNAQRALAHGARSGGHCAARPPDGAPGARRLTAALTRAPARVEVRGAQLSGATAKQGSVEIAASAGMYHLTQGQGWCSAGYVIPLPSMHCQELSISTSADAVLTGLEIISGLESACRVTIR